MDARPTVQAAGRSLLGGLALVAVDLLALGFVVVLVPVLLVAHPAVEVLEFSPVLAIAGLGLAQLAWIPLALPVLTVVYPLAAGTGLSGIADAPGRALRRAGRHLLPVLLVERGVALVLSLVTVPLVVAVVLGAHTVGKALWYAVDPAAGLEPLELVIFVGTATVAVGVTFGGLPVASARRCVLLEGEDVPTALEMSRRRVERAPVAALGHWLARVALSLPLLVLVGLVAAVDGPQPLPLAAAYATLAVPARSAWLWYVVRRPGPGSRSESRGRPSAIRRASPARTAVALLVVIALVGGVAGVRTAEIRPNPEPAGVGPDEPEPAALLSAGNRHLASESFRLVSRETRCNASTGAEEGTSVFRWAVDRRRNRVRTTLDAYAPNGTARDGGFEVYLSENTWAMTTDRETPPVGAEWRAASPDETSSGEWSSLPLPVYAVLSDGSSGRTVEATDANWMVREGTEATVTLVLSGAAVARVGVFENPDREVGANSSVSITVERRSGRITRVVGQYAPPEDDERRSYVCRTGARFEYEDTRVRRPAAIGPKGPVEWLWDLAFY